jgi:hypothetical protein
MAVRLALLELRLCGISGLHGSNLQQSAIYVQVNISRFTVRDMKIPPLFAVQLFSVSVFGFSEGCLDTTPSCVADSYVALLGSPSYPSHKSSNTQPDTWNNKDQEKGGEYSHEVTPRIRSGIWDAQDCVRNKNNESPLKCRNRWRNST